MARTKSEFRVFKEELKGEESQSPDANAPRWRLLDLGPYVSTLSAMRDLRDVAPGTYMVAAITKTVQIKQQQVTETTVTEL